MKICTAVICPFGWTDHVPSQGVTHEVYMLGLNPLTMWYFMSLCDFVLISDLLFIGDMWPPPNPTWRSSTGPPPGHPGQPIHYPAWTSTTSATPTMFFQGQHAPAPSPRDLLPPQPDVHQYHQLQLQPHHFL